MAQKVKRVNYFDGQFLHEKDFNDEQRYHVQYQRDHARLLHTPGIAEGLDVPDQGGTSPNFTGLNTSAVTVTEGVAYDGQGRRMVLAEAFAFELASKLPGQNVIYVTAAYGGDDTPSQDPEDQATVTGVTKATRWIEKAVIDAFAQEPDPNEKVLLAKVTRGANAIITQIDRSQRRGAGIRGGDLAVVSLTLESTEFPGGSVRTELGASGRADIGGNLQVTGNLIVQGTIQGGIAVGSGNLASNAVVSAKLAEADGTSAQDTESGSGVKTGHLQNGAVTNVKIGTDVSNRIAVGETHAARTDNPHNTTAAQIDTAGGANRIVAQINAGGGGIINAARIDAAIARTTQITASAIDTAGGANQLVTQVNAGSGTINAARVDAAIARLSQVTASAVDAAGGANQLVTQINAGTGVINAARLSMPEKLNGKYISGSATLPLPAPGTVNITTRDLRGKLIKLRGWMSSASDGTPSFLAAGTQVRAWTLPTQVVQEAWAFCKTTAPSPTSVAVFSITEGANTVAFQLEFTSTQLNLRMTGPANFTFGYVFQVAWQE